ncbi:MAG TPA: carboxypeptidase-like regulatory domain-containing protein, partial [Burkholderiales bacterium]|nr:carboxypeptidase-like regulatory domain-containing protein [Burkholderiales bacterium]
MRRGIRTPVSWGLVFILGLSAAPLFLASQTPAKGRLVGFVFGQDGSTPVAGAVVIARNVSTGALIESTRSDETGAFRVENLDAGIYSLGVSSAQGSFNSQDLVGIKPDETAKVSIALNTYDRDALEAARTVAREEKERGESRVGKVVSYNTASKEALVVVERGLIQVGDRVRVKGVTTDFSQDVKLLKVQGARAKMCLAGQQGVFPAARPCAVGDTVFIVCKRGVPPLFLAPLGLAAIVAGSATLVSLEQEEPVSPTRPTV